MNKLLKKVIGLGIVLTMSTSLLIGCGSKTTSNEGNTEKSGGSDLPEVTWKISHSQAPDHFMNIAMENMSKYVSENTDGKFNIEVFHSGTLGTEQEVIEGMQMGTVAGNLAATTLLANFVPSYNLFSIPGLFDDEAQLEKVLNDEATMGKFREAALEQGIMEVGYYQSYFRQLYTKTPITDVASFKSQKIRVMGSPVLVDTFQALEANPSTTAWAELYSGLQLGVDDGLDHVASSVKSMSFYDHLGYVSEPKLFPTPMFLVISKPLYDKLPDEYKTVLDEAMKLGVEELNQKANQANIDDLEFLKTEGGLEYSEANVEEIHGAIEGVKQEYIGQLEDWVQEIAAEIDAME
jgi:TRAP-type C4-dicarboxylate transport system substrate-binding protein